MDDKTTGRHAEGGVNVSDLWKQAMGDDAPAASETPRHSTPDSTAPEIATERVSETSVKDPVITPAERPRVETDVSNEGYAGGYDEPPLNTPADDRPSVLSASLKPSIIATIICMVISFVMFAFVGDLGVGVGLVVAAVLSILCFLASLIGQVIVRALVRRHKANKYHPQHL